MSDLDLFPLELLSRRRHPVPVALIGLVMIIDFAG
jgi:hypothetical protein